MSGGGGGGTQTIQKADPWSGLAPYLIGDAKPNIGGQEGLFQQAAEWMRGAGPQFYPGQTVADPSNYTNIAESSVADVAGRGSPLDADARSLARYLAGGDEQRGMFNEYTNLLSNDATASGGFLNANPYLDRMVDASTRDINRNFSNTVLPGVASQFALGGRYGSGAQQQVLGNVSNDYTNKLGDIVTGIRGTNYANERGLMENRRGQILGLRASANEGEANRRLAGASMLNQMNTEDYNRWWQNINALGQVGAAQDARAQGRVNADIQRWDYGQNQPLSKLQAYAQLLQGGWGGGQSTSQTTGPSGPSGFQRGLSGAAGGAMAGSAFGPWGTAIGAGIGGLLSLF